MKRIVHIFNSSIVSGPETLVLPALKALPYEINVIFLKETRRPGESDRPVKYAESLGLKTYTVAVRSRFDRKAIHDLAELLEKIDPFVVHAHDVKASTYLIRATAMLPRHQFKTFSTHHGVRGRKGWKLKLYERFYSHFVLPKFDRVLAVCSSDCKLLLSRGLSSRRVRVHLNGVDRRLIEPSQRASEAKEIRRKWKLESIGVSSGPVIMGVVGRIAPEKRIDRILDILHEMDSIDSSAQWVLLVFGTGPLEEELKAKTARLQLEKRVVWMGYRSGLGDELAGLDILISLSDAEGLPINLVEAGWAGTPVFATAVDGNLDLISHPGEGVLFSPHASHPEIAQKLMALVRDASQRDSIGRAFQAKVKTQFSGTRWVKELESLYCEADV